MTGTQTVRQRLLVAKVVVKEQNMEETALTWCSSQFRFHVVVSEKFANTICVKTNQIQKLAFKRRSISWKSALITSLKDSVKRKSISCALNQLTMKRTRELWQWVTSTRDVQWAILSWRLGIMASIFVQIPITRMIDGCQQSTLILTEWITLTSRNKSTKTSSEVQLETLPELMPRNTDLTLPEPPHKPSKNTRAPEESQN